MTPIVFPECNRTYGPPRGLEESQCSTVAAYEGQVDGGSLDGDKLIVVAYKPNPDELERLNRGFPIYLTCLEILPPHFLSTTFDEATHPA